MIKTKLLWTLALFLIACRPQANNNVEDNESPFFGRTAMDLTPSIPVQPVFGYRFIITGNFNGDRLTDTLTEHYISQHDFKEVNKFYKTNKDYGFLVGETIEKEPLTYISCSNPSIDSLIITDDQQQLGLSFLKNEGDLDGDGRDEISYVINHADWSNLNTCYILSYKHGTWQRRYSFPVWDWQLPSLPETQNQYGLIGIVNKVVLDTADERNRLVSEAFTQFPGLIQKITNHKFEVQYRNPEAMMDTLLVDLRDHKPVEAH